MSLTLVNAANIAIIISVIYAILTIVELCISPAIGGESKAIKYRFINVIVSHLVVIECVLALIHFSQPNTKLYIIALLLIRSIVHTLFCIGANLFINKTFRTLYQSKLQQKAPKWLVFTVNFSFLFFAVFMVTCIILAFHFADHYFIELWNIAILVWPACVTIAVIFGLIDVVKEMTKILSAMEQNFNLNRPSNSNIDIKPSLTLVNVSTTSSQKRTSSMNNKSEEAFQSLLRTKKQLQRTIIVAMTFLCICGWFCYTS